MTGRPPARRPTVEATLSTTGHDHRPANPWPWGRPCPRPVEGNQAAGERMRRDETAEPQNPRESKQNKIKIKKSDGKIAARTATGEDGRVTLSGDRPLGPRQIILDRLAGLTTQLATDGR